MTSGLKAKAALSERGDDLYETPPVAITALLGRETLPPVVWAPACGPGAIVGVLRAAGHTVIATDLNDLGCPDSVRVHHHQPAIQARPRVRAEGEGARAEGRDALKARIS